VYVDVIENLLKQKKEKAAAAASEVDKTRSYSCSTNLLIAIAAFSVSTGLLP